jgi:hypothetical protein
MDIAAMKKLVAVPLVLLAGGGAALAQQPNIVKNDFQIDALDAGIKIFMRDGAGKYALCQ